MNGSPLRACFDGLFVLGLLTEHALYTRLVGITYQGRPGEAQLGILIPVPKPVRGIGLKALHLSGTGYFKALFGAAMSLHFRHGLSCFGQKDCKDRHWAEMYKPGPPDLFFLLGGDHDDHPAPFQFGQVLGCAQVLEFLEELE